MARNTAALPTTMAEKGRLNVLRCAEFLVVPVVVLALWKVAALIIGPVAVASPAATIEAIVSGVVEGWLLAAMVHTMYATAMATLLASIIGLWLGFMLGMSPYWGKVLEGPLLWIYSTPKVTLFPVFLLVLGLSMGTEVTFGAFHGIFPLTLFLLSAIRATPEVFFKVGHVYNISRWKTFTRIIVPETLPSMVTGLRYCFSLTFLGVILAEMFAARAGAGYALVQAMSLHRVPRTFAVAIVLILSALAVNGLFLLLQRRVERRRGTPD